MSASYAIPRSIRSRSTPAGSASGGGCTLRHAHGGWTEANAGDRAKFNDWAVLLDRFVQLTEAGD